MSVTDTHPNLQELARLGRDVFDHQIRPSLRPEHEGKFVAIDLKSGDYEIDEDDYLAISRLRIRNPAAEVWLEMAGQPTAYKMRRGQ